MNNTTRKQLQTTIQDKMNLLHFLIKENKQHEETIERYKQEVIDNQNKIELTRKEIHELSTDLSLS